MIRSACVATGIACALTAAPCGAASCEGGVKDILPPVLLPIEAPQGIAVDSSDGSLWIVSAISTTVLHVGADLRVLGSFESPFAASGRHETGGIAYRSDEDTLLISQPILLEVAEVAKDGTPTGLTIPLNLPAPPNLIPRPFAKGLEFNPRGDGGRGSIWVVESVLSAVYEVSLGGEVLGSFCAPLDPDGCPGNGAAAFVNDVGIFNDHGAPTGLEVTGGLERRDRILRVGFDGAYGGVSIPLAEIGGRVGGFARGRVRDPVSGEERAALFVTVESSAELHALADEEPRIMPIDGLRCTVEGGGAAGNVVRLAWRDFGNYDSLRITRDGELIATLPGGAESFDDVAPPDGVLNYEVAGTSGDCETRAHSTAVVGAGQVLKEAPFDGLLAVDLTEDASEYLWVTDVEKRIVVYDKDLTLVTSLPSPFQDDGDETSGIAFNPKTGTFFIYNASTNLVAEINDLGEVITPPFPSGVPSDPDDKAEVTAMLFDPAGAGGDGSFWYLDRTRGVIEERSRSGDLLGSCVHPDEASEPPPPKTYLDAFAWGMSEAPGGGFTELYVSGGRVRDQGTTRILRIGARTCRPLGEEIPADAIGTSYVAVHRTQHGGKPVIFALAADAYRSRILEVDVRPPPVPFVRDLECRQPAAARDVRIAFTNPGGIDAVLVRRSGQPIATLPGDASSFTDRDVPAGLRGYEVACERGAAPSDGRACSIEVGPGSIARREFSAGVNFVHAISRDPADGTYIAASSSNRYSDNLYRFGPDLAFVESFLSPFPYPMQVAALAVRAPAGGKSEVFCLGWQPGAQPGEQRALPLRVTDRLGRVLREVKTAMPKPRGNFVTFPSGMAWDAATDTLWYLERNAFTVVNIDLDGDVIAAFPHPAPIHQDGVFNFGIAIAGERNALYLSSAGRLDYQITKLVELTRGGQLTGVEVPIGKPSYDLPWGFALNGDGTAFVVAAGAYGAWDLVETRAFDPLAPVRALRCGVAESLISLAWENGEAYDSVAVYREKSLVATLSGDAVTFEDAPSPASFYRVVGVKGPFSSAGSICEPNPSRNFVRGDVEENGEVNITDAIAILLYLFSGGVEPACLDAADVDDSGEVNITDPIALLGYLFNAGRAPAAPFPLPGRDPTPDGFRCDL